MDADDDGDDQEEDETTVATHLLRFCRGLLSPGGIADGCADQVHPLHGGVHANLYNNLWGTAFPQWYDRTTAWLAFRFLADGGRMFDVLSRETHNKPSSISVEHC